MGVGQHAHTHIFGIFLFYFLFNTDGASNRQTNSGPTARPSLQIFSFRSDFAGPQLDNRENLRGPVSPVPKFSRGIGRIAGLCVHLYIVGGYPGLRARRCSGSDSDFPASAPHSVVAGTSLLTSGGAFTF